MLQVAELERLANGSRTELHIVENSWHVHKSDSRVAEILQTFETIDHYMNLAHSDQANVRPGSKQPAMGGDHDRGTRKMPFLMEPQLTMSNQTNTDSDDESRVGKEDGHEDLMMIDQVDKSLGDTKRR